MDKALFERLLLEEESITLDFKGGQYPFVKASDEDKSEILKDIIGFANALGRDKPAYILIGVNEVRGDKSEVVGVSEHLDDHSLQQFVNSLANKHIQFSYEAFIYEGKQVGIIRIEVQVGPFSPKRNYGRLKRDAAYIRRGSQTDLGKPASNDELFQMGRLSTDRPIPKLNIEFYNVLTKEPLSKLISWDSVVYEGLMLRDIPDYEDSPRDVWHSLRINALINKDYYRKLAEYEFARKFFTIMGISVRNTGSASATGVRVELSVVNDKSLSIIQAEEFPKRPKKMYEDPMRKSELDPVVRLHTGSGSIGIEWTEKVGQIYFDCGDLQPGRKFFSEPLFVGRFEPGKVELHGVAYSHTLEAPYRFELAMDIGVVVKSLTLDYLKSLPDENE